MSLAEDIGAAFEAAAGFADDGETLTGVVPIEPAAGARVYLCSYEREEERRWLALDTVGRPLTDRRLVREAVGVAALVEFADESAGGGDVGELRARLSE